MDISLGYFGRNKELNVITQGNEMVKLASPRNEGVPRLQLVTSGLLEFKASIDALYHLLNENTQKKHSQ